MFPDIRKMEAEVVRMACNMFNGTEDSCGTVSRIDISLGYSSFFDRLGLPLHDIPSL